MVKKEQSRIGDSNMLCALIMAGGVGSRFWPQSTEKKPKQFLNLIGNKTMIQMTYDRVKKLVDIDKIFVVTNEKYVDMVKEQLTEIPDKNIIVEPCARNTAPCILLSSLYIRQIYNNANVSVLPSDHIISNEDKFIETLKLANDYINNVSSNSIVTIGINPNRPETGYGYIKFIGEKKEKEIVNVEKFVEKPNFEKALQYINDGRYLWNGGMFIFNIEYMLSELLKNCPEMYKTLIQLPKFDDDNYNNVLQKLYPKCESVSIDYAVMEKSNSIKVIPADFGWDDVGTWQSLERYMSGDENGNIGKGSDIEFVDSNNCIAYGLNKKIILYNVNDLFVTEGEDAIVVTNKKSMDKIKTLKKD